MTNRCRLLFFRASLVLLLGAPLASVAVAGGDDPVPPIPLVAEAAAQETASVKHGDDRVTIFSDNTVAAADTVDGDAVAVFGDLRIDGTVHGDAVALMGDLTLGPNAAVDGDVVCVAGKLHRSSDARVEGRVIRRGLGVPFYFLPSWRTVFFDGFRSRPVWLFNLAILSLYALVALVFPRGIRQCGETLVERPGLSILSAILSLLVLPVLFILLFVSFVGIPVAIIVLPLGVIGLMMFGKASFYGLMGRAISRDGLPPAAAVFVGGLICILFFLVPVVGLLLSFLLSVLMLGCGVVTLFGAEKKPVSPPYPGNPIPPGPTASRTDQATAPAGPSAEVLAGEEASAKASSSTHAASPLESVDVPPFTSPPVPPPLQAAAPSPMAAAAADPATLPRAGFWIRLLALLIDFVLVAAVFHVFGPFCLILLAAYGAIMWKLKGTTVGGIICGLKVVRLDGRPIDWNTAIARAAGCFLSMIALNIGFIWVAFDHERQSWHDKIAGTTVVHAPRGASLV